MNITSRQLKAFVLTARHQSFSRAAEQLFITQSGMSVLVRELESQLGFRLFERTTRKVTLTEFGSKFLPIAERSLRDLESTVASLSRSAAAAKDCLSIGAAPFPAAELMPQAIAGYMALNPRVHIQMIDAEAPRLMEMVQSGKIDAALSAWHHELPGVFRLPLARFPLMLICAEEAPAHLAPAVRWPEVAALRLIGAPRDYPIQVLVDEQLALAGRHAPPDVVCNYLETQIAMVEVGAGAAVIPTSAAPACAKRRIRMHAIFDPVVRTSFYWVVSRTRKISASAEDFSLYLKDYLGQIAEQWTLPCEPLQEEGAGGLAAEPAAEPAPSLAAGASSIG